MMTMQKQAEAFGAKVIQAQVLSIDKTGGNFIVKTKKAAYEAACLCLATGAIHRNLEVPGEKEFSSVVYRHEEMFDAMANHLIMELPLS